MSEAVNQIDMLVRREIEAGVIGPLVDQFGQVLGKEEALAQVAKVAQRLAAEAGAQMAENFGGNSMEHFHKVPDIWKKGGALEIEVEAADQSQLVFKVTRCRYAEMYRELGYAELGEVMSCSRDEPLARGFNPKIKMTRSKTIMAGDSYCDFKFELEE